ncbi:ROK family protein [Streptomyces sp. XH2]|uniref:ROK family protein n=1 Tax=Streptomyces sp. XH2 TaxID=3412483 RepID=UPI003C7CB2AE
MSLDFARLAGRLHSRGSGTLTVMDVGGTHVRTARWSPDGGLSDVTDQPSPSRLLNPAASVAELQRRMVGVLCDAVPAGPGAVAGVSFGAALCHRRGLVYASAPLWGDHSRPFELKEELLARRPDVEWHVVNDVTAALLHLAWSPQSAGRRKMLLMTISSGIACRTIDCRRAVIPTDGWGLQGEVGHLPATARLAGEPVELPCACGTTGHLAAYASGPGIRRMAEVLEERVPVRWKRSRLARELASGQDFEEAFGTALDAYDPVAHELLTAVTEPVAAVLRTALCLDPEIDQLALTGGVAQALAGHYRRAILLWHLTREGLYLTSESAPEWVSERLVVPGPDEVNGLVGAGIHALLSMGGAAGDKKHDEGHDEGRRTTVRGGSAHDTGPGTPPGTHCAIVCDETGLGVRRMPTPRPGPGELVVAPQLAGLCGTDLQMLRGLRDDGAPVLGHEGVARVTAVGEGVGPSLAPGTTVVINPTHHTDAAFLLGHTVDGLLQQRTLVPATAVRGGLVVPLAEPPEAELAALLEPLAVVRYSFQILQSLRPRTLLVFGDGTVGHLAVRAARRWLGEGVRTVHVHHTEEGRAWSAASRHPADHLLRHDLAGISGLADAVGPGPVAVVLATPRDATLTCLETVLGSLAGETARGVAVDLLGGLPPGARTPLLPGADLPAIRAENLAGLPFPPRVVPVETAAGGSISLFGHRGVANDHLLDASRELNRNPGHYRELVTHVAGLEEAAGIMRHLAGTRDRTVEGRRLIKLAVRLGPVDDGASAGRTAA